MLQRASVIGRDFSIGELGAISPTEERASLERTVETVASKELIRPLAAPPGEERWRFRHLMIRDVAYEGIAKGVRAGYHERYADLLEERAGHRLEELEEIVAYHLDQAYRYRSEVGPADASVGVLGVRAGSRFAGAGVRAVTRGDTAATVKLLGRAAELLPADDRRRIAFLPLLADALFQLGERERAESALDEMRASAERAAEPGLVARAELERYTWRLITDPASTDGEGLRRVAERAVRICEERGETDQLPAALESLTIAHRLVTGDAAAMLAASERGLGLARDLDAGAGFPVGDVNLEGVAGALILGATPYPDVLVRLAELAADLRGPMAQATIGLHEAFALGRTGRFADARARSAASAGIFDDLGQRRWVAETRHTDGLIARWEGDLETSADRIGAAYRSFADRGEASDAALTATDLADVLYELGRLDEAERLVRAVEREMPGYALEPAIAWRRVRAKLLATRGETEQAERRAREAETIAARTDFLALQAGSLHDLAVVLALAGRSAEAMAAAARAVEVFERKGDAVGAAAARSLSPVGDPGGSSA
jgi:tetratricopeptide (TPR) repeat protein